MYTKKKTLQQLDAGVGAIIGRGAFGCVIKPCIHIYPAVDNGNTNLKVSKILKIRDARLEIEVLDDIGKVDPLGIYSTVMTENGFLTAEIIRRQEESVQRDILDCIGKENPIDYSIINMTYVGNSLDKHLTCGSGSDPVSRNLRAEKRFMKTNYKDIFIKLLEGLNHFHTYGVALRDIKPENIAFGEHLQLREVVRTKPPTSRKTLKKKKKKGFLSKKKRSPPKVNSNNFEFVNSEETGTFNKEHYCKYIDFGISLNFRKDKREVINEILVNTTFLIKGVPEENQHNFKRTIDKCEKELFMQELIHNSEFNLTTIEEADIIIQEIFTGTLIYIPPEHYFLLMILIDRFPKLINKGYITHQILKTIIRGKPYSEELVMEFLTKILVDFRIYSKEDIDSLPEILADLTGVDKLENQFFKGDFSNPKNVLLPLISHQDYYSLGLTMNTIMHHIGIRDESIMEIIRELSSISIYQRTDVNLLELADRIKSL